MPVINDVPATRGPRVVLHPSVAIELQWALSAAEGPAYHAVLAGAYDRSPGLADRAHAFWGEELAISCASFIELMVLAFRGGILFSRDAGMLLRRLDELCTMPPPAPGELRLASEPESDRIAILARLEQLRSSADRRAEYVRLLTDVWTALGDAWERDGWRAVDAAVATRQELLAKGAPWPEVVRTDYDFDGLTSRLVEGMGPSDLLAVVPAYFTRRGLVVDLPGVLVVGVGTDQTGAESRARTELLARRLKSISDPTRLAILDSLSRHAATVTEIANSFGLAQPTVSNHVKLLRDAGLIGSAAGGSGTGTGGSGTGGSGTGGSGTGGSGAGGSGLGGSGTGGSGLGSDGRTGPRSGGRELVVQPDAVADLLDHLRAVLRPGSGPDD